MYKKYSDQYKEFCTLRNKIFDLIKKIGYDIIEKAPVFYVMDKICGYSSYKECLGHYKDIVVYTKNNFNAPYKQNKKHIKFMGVAYKRCLKFYNKEMKLIKNINYGDYGDF